MSEPVRRLVVAISGASGARYAALFLRAVAPVVERVAVVFSAVAPQVVARELGVEGRDPDALLTALLGDTTIPANHRVERYALDDFGAPFASGSNAYDAMVAIPCSQGLLARIANGISDTLITRAADVCLKERKPLIVVPRETPLSLIHLRNQVALTEAGGTVLPACPSFYGLGDDLEGALWTVVDRVLAHLGLERPGAPRWGEDTEHE